MAMLRQCLNSTIILSLLLGWHSAVLAIPDQTMSVTPSATSGGTILAADENTRNSNISTPFNAHSHTDITQVATPLNVGASSGRSSIGDASVVLEGATNDASETTLTVTDPTADRTITFPNATGTVQLYADSAFIAGNFTRDTSLATGTQAVTGVGFTPRAILFIAAQDASREASWGMDDNTNNLVLNDDAASANTYEVRGDSSIFDDESTAPNTYAGTISTFDSDGFTVSWTRTGTPTGTLSVRYLAFR